MVLKKKLFQSIDLTEGKPWQVILLFSIPILFSSILGNAFSLINSLILKETVGGDSVVAINSTSSISMILFQFAYGCSGGFSIVMSEHIGRKDYSSLRKIFYNAIYLCIGLGLFITILGLFVYKDLLVLLNINDRYMTGASNYYSILLIAFVFMLLSNFFYSALRAIGDSFAPLVISLIGTVINIALAFLLTGVIRLDTRGVAIATTVSNVVCMIIAYIYTTKKYSYMALNGEKELLDKKECLKMMKLGLPLGFQWSILFIGSFFESSSINKFESGLATKAASCYSPFINYLSIPIHTISSAMLSYIGQNYGKQDYDRIKQGFKQTLVLDIALWFILALVSFSLIKYVPYIFLPASEVNDLVEGPFIQYYTSMYLKVSIPCLVFQAILTLCRSTLQGIQKTMIPFLSGIGELFARISICAFLPSLIDPSNPLSNEAYIGICFSTPAAWIISTIIMGGSVVYFLFMKKNKKSISNQN